MNAVPEQLSPDFNQSNKKAIGIRGRLLIGFSCIVIILLLIVGTTLAIFSNTRETTVKLINVELPVYDSFLNLGMQISRSHSLILRWIISKDPKYRDELDLIWENNILPAVHAIDSLSNKMTNTDIQKKWNDIKLFLNQLKASEEKTFNLSHSDMASMEMHNALLQIEKYVDDILTIIDGPKNTFGVRHGGLFDELLLSLNQRSTSIINDMNAIQITEYVLSIVCIVFAIIIAGFTSRGILKHINKFRQQSSRIASGDLRQYLSIHSNDEMGQLGHDLNAMTKSLSDITKKITEVCHNMVTSLDEVQHAIDMQSSGATEQAASINQITSSLDEIQKSSAQTMEKAKALGDIAERTREKGQMGLEAVEQSIKGMKSVRDKVETIAQTILDLSNQTQQVGEITTVVNTLAQQSKMLALNASIEAAKAGEAGKGFAVVAVEVKNLAEQSEQATTQVQKILESIRHAAEKAVMVTEEGTKGVDQGTSLVEQTGEIVHGLSDVIHETTIASQQIEAAVRQETVGIEQITAGMNEINLVTSSFVESVNQTIEAIKNLTVIAKNLKEHIDTYKT